jgi:two-component system, chemotaxis family, chemotaxis protein CheY
MKILIVDDSNLIRTRIARVIGMGGLPGAQVVGQASNGAQAVHIARAARPDAITMDLTMPEMDGVAAIKALIALNPGFNILVVSALADKTTAIAALRHGARGFLNKPFTDAELITALQDVVSSNDES